MDVEFSDIGWGVGQGKLPEKAMFVLKMVVGMLTTKREFLSRERRMCVGSEI
jgi:hypothetical protein